MIPNPFSITNTQAQVRAALPDLNPSRVERARRRSLQDPLHGVAKRIIISL